jgi:hypothetical protein
VKEGMVAFCPSKFFKGHLLENWDQTELLGDAV